MCMYIQLLVCSQLISRRKKLWVWNTKLKLKCLKFKWLSIPVGHANCKSDRNKHQGHIYISIKVNLLQLHT
jgi:hypothetical protein